MTRSWAHVVVCACGLSLIPMGATAAARQAAQATALTPEQARRIETVVRDAMARHGIPGMSVAVGLHNHLAFTAGYGLADIENSVPVTPSTVFRLASISKAITAVAVLQLAEEGKLDLSAPIQRYVPEYPAKRWPVTALDLLSHLSGVRHYTASESLSTKHYPSMRAGLNMFRDSPLIHEPGTKFTYSTHGYTLLGCAVEAASGEPYFTYVEQRIARRALMDSLRVDDTYAIIPFRADGYRRGRGGDLLHAPLHDTSYKVAGGGMSGTAQDLVKLAIALVTDALLKPDVVARMLAPARQKNGKPIGYGLGWAQYGKVGEDPAVGHAGGQSGVSTLLFMVPKLGFAFAATCNLQGVELLPLARAVAGEILQPGGAVR